MVADHKTAILIPAIVAEGPLLSSGTRKPVVPATLLSAKDVI